MEIKYLIVAGPGVARPGEAGRGSARHGKDTLGMVYNCPYIMIFDPFKSGGDQIDVRRVWARRGVTDRGGAGRGMARTYIVESF